MFSPTCLQPQILTAVSELTSLLHFPRVCVSMPTRRQHTKSDKQKHSQDYEEKTILEAILPKNLNVKEIYPFLNADCEIQNTVVGQLCKEVQNRNKGVLWRETFVSAETFFENKTGFPESLIQIQNENSIELSTGTQNRELNHRFLQATIQHLFFQQNRGFKTKRSIAPERRSGFFFKLRRPDTETSAESKAETSADSSGNTSKTNSDETVHFLNKYLPKDGKLEGRSKTTPTIFSQADLEFIIDSKNKKSWSVMPYVLIFIVCSLLLYINSLFPDGVVDKMLGSKHDFEVDSSMKKVSFDDVRGAQEAKQELQDIVEFLKNPKKFTALGGKLPKGVLLVGPPGTGKTLLARAVAGEADVPFLYCSGSDFDRIFVGSGVKKVKMLFEKAREQTPCLIFIDEIDSVARKRTSSSFHPYANQTINSLLSEIDGFNQTEGIIIIGATNRVDDLDQAILRPGRFDTQVKVSVPDLKERMDILELYLKKVKASESIDILGIARGTPRFTGADLESLVNKAALRAAYLGDKEITMEHIEFAKDNILMGPAKKNKIDDEKTTRSTAIHEAGHTVVAYYSKHADPLNKVTIIPRGQTLGFTSMLPETDGYSCTKSQLLAKMDVCMGGRVAEELINGSGEITSGAANDFEVATKIATEMVKVMGMSEKVGVRSYSSNENNKDVPSIVDSEIDRLLQESYKRAKDLLIKHAEEHKNLVEALVKYETLDAEDIKTVMEGKPLKISKPLLHDYMRNKELSNLIQQKKFF